MASTTRQSLNLYKQMMREAQKFADFNFRSYALRRIREGFKDHKGVTGEEAKKGMEEAKKNLEMIRRQVTVGQLFNSGQRLSIEVNPDK